MLHGPSVITCCFVVVSLHELHFKGCVLDCNVLHTETLCVCTGLNLCAFTLYKCMTTQLAIMKFFCKMTYFILIINQQDNDLMCPAEILAPFGGISLAKLSLIFCCKQVGAVFCIQGEHLQRRRYTKTALEVQTRGQTLSYWVASLLQQQTDPELDHLTSLWSPYKSTTFFCTSLLPTCS